MKHAEQLQLTKLTMNSMSRDPSNLASLKYDPFLTRVGGPEGSSADLIGKPGTEEQPLMSDNGGAPGSKGGEAKLMILPTACCMMTQTCVSVVALAMSFSETGHRSGYEEGHLDATDQSSGCEAVFYWMMAQASLDLIITSLVCLFIVSRMTSEPVGMHGCAATVRLCTLAAGFHILYFSGLKRELCDPFLIIWSTILVWTGVGIMVLAGCVLTCMLLGATGQETHPRYRPRQQPKMKGAGGAYATTFNA